MNYVLGEFCFHFLYLIKNKLVLELHWSNTVAESKEAESSRHEELWVGEAMQRSWTSASSCFAEPLCQGSRAMHRGVVGQELEHRAPPHRNLHPTVMGTSQGIPESLLRGCTNQGWRPWCLLLLPVPEMAHFPAGLGGFILHHSWQCTATPKSKHLQFLFP